MALLYFAPQFLDANGSPLSAGTLSVFDNGTTTPATIYSDPALSTSVTNPVTLDSAGRPSTAIYVTTGTKYTVQLKDSSGTSQWSLNDVHGWALDGEAPVVNATNAGAIGDGTTDDTAALQAIIDSFTSGGVMYLPVGTYLISSTLTIPNSNIIIRGEGADRSHDTGGQGTLAATTLKWGGAANGTMVDIYSPSGTSNQKHVGCGIERIYFDANSNADFGVKIRSQSVGFYKQLHFEEFGVAAMKLMMIDTLGDARDVNHNTFSQISCRAVTNASSLFILEGDTGGTPTSNVSINYFENCYAIYANGDAYSIFNADHNYFHYCRAFRTGAGTGNGIVFEGTSTAGGQVARHNVFWNYGGAGGPIVARGTTTYTTASYDNSVLYVDKGNSTPDPTIETGSSLHYSTDQGILYSHGMERLVVASTAAKAISERDNVGTESLRIQNGGSNHIRLVDNSSNEFGINLTAGDMRINNAAGGGGVWFNTDIGFHGTLPQSKPTITGSRGGNAALADLLTQLAAYGLITDSTT